MIYIYGLKASGSNSIMYVGRSKSPAERLLLTLRYDISSDSKKSQWLSSVLASGQTVEMVIIDATDRGDEYDMEVFWIDYFAQRNPSLTNTVRPRSSISVHTNGEFSLHNAKVITAEMAVAACEYLNVIKDPVMRIDRRKYKINAGYYAAIQRPRMSCD